MHLLYGPKGVGRKSSVQWAVDKINPSPFLINLDAMMCFEEN
jgi:hypothetical protein